MEERDKEIPRLQLSTDTIDVAIACMDIQEIWEVLLNDMLTRPENICHRKMAV